MFLHAQFPAGHTLDAHNRTAVTRVLYNDVPVPYLSTMQEHQLLCRVNYVAAAASLGVVSLPWGDTARRQKCLRNTDLQVAEMARERVPESMSGVGRSEWR